MTSIDVRTELEGRNQWTYKVRLTADQHCMDYTVRLNWADYDLWSHGRVAPERVVKAVFEFLLKKEPASSILTDFDCSVIRRYFPEVDRELPQMF